MLSRILPSAFAPWTSILVEYQPKQDGQAWLFAAVCWESRSAASKRAHGR